MTIARINWTTATRGARVVPGVLIAGVPHLITIPGVSITGVTWTDDSDPAWFVGSSPSVKGWLANGRDAAPLVIEERASPVQGKLSVRVPDVELYDDEGVITRLLASRSLPFVLLAADLSATGTTLTTDVPDASVIFGASGVAHIGRERITYTGTSGGSLTGCTRGTAGTAAIAYRAQSGHRVYAAPSGVDVLPSVVKRRVTLWALLINDAGAVVDPTLLADCRGAIGATLDSSRAAWSLPLRHVIDVLSEKADAPFITVRGIMHRGIGFRGASIVGENVPDYNALCATWQAPSGGGGATMCLESGGTGVDVGWHPTRESFLSDWNVTAAGLSTTLNTNPANGTLGVFAAHGSDRRLVARFGWEGRTVASPDDPTDGTERTAVYSNTPFPDACMWLYGAVPFSPSDIAQVPSLPGALPADVIAYWTLRTERDNGFVPKRTITSKIRAVGSSTLTLEAVDVQENSHAALLITRPTAARLGLWAEGPSWPDVIRHGVLTPLADARGLDHLQDAFAWDHLVNVVRSSPGLGSDARRYDLDITEPLTELFNNETRLHAGALVTHHGRVSMATFPEVPITARTVASFTTTDFLASELPNVSQCRDDLATSFKITLPNGDVVRVVDAAAVKESGEGEEIEVTAPRGCLTETAAGLPLETITGLAVSTLAPWSHPYDVAELPLPLAAVGVEIGDIISVKEWSVPNLDGGRGLHAPGFPSEPVRCMVFGRKIDLSDGHVVLSVRMAGGAVYGYAPSALVSGITGAVLTLDTVTCGPCGFGATYREDGTLRTDGGADYFEPGFKVLLLEIDTETPGTPFSAEVVSTSGATVTLDSAPGAAWEALASAGRVMLEFVRWDTATVDQKQWAYIADDATNTLSDGTLARRYA